MTTMQEQDVQALLDRIQALRQVVESAGDQARAVLRAIEPGLLGMQQELGIDAAGRLPAGKWNRLPENLRASLQKRLEGAVAGLAGAVEPDPDGPKDPNSIMFKAYASNVWVWGLFLGAILGTAVVIWGIYRYWPAATGPKPSEAEVLRMIILMGALGGFLHWTSSFAKFVGNRQLLRSWVIYYVLTPFEGASLAPLIYLLLRVGVLAPGTQTTSEATAGPAGMNLFGLYAFAGLTGLFSKQAIEMLADVFSIIFKKIQAKDSLEVKKDTQEGATKPAAGGGQTP